MADEQSHKERHDMRPRADCNVCLFLDGAVEESDVDGGTFEIGRIAITPEWQGDYYGWRRAIDE